MYNVFWGGGGHLFGLFPTLAKCGKNNKHPNDQLSYFFHLVKKILSLRYIRTHMSQEGLSRIRGLRDDDLVLNFDADEIPKAEVSESWEQKYLRN